MLATAHTPCPGRQAEQDRLSEWLVSLGGPGGAGKTRLALAAV